MIKALKAIAFILAVFVCVYLLQQLFYADTQKSDSGVACNIYLDFTKNNILDVGCGLLDNFKIVPLSPSPYGTGSKASTNVDIILEFSDYKFSDISSNSTNNTNYVCRVKMANKYTISSFKNSQLQIIKKNMITKNKQFSGTLSLSSNEIRAIKNGNEIEKPFDTFRLVFSPF
jgi:hypothetical protein